MIGFTLCANNFLAAARSLADSWVRTQHRNPFVIGLVDRLNPELDYSVDNAVSILPVEQLKIPTWAAIAAKYDVTELCCAVKPYYFEHLLARSGDGKAIYLDPDIILFGELRLAAVALDEASLAVTPHICSPVPGTAGPNDYHLLRSGVFNLGFFGLARSETSLALLRWWQLKMVDHAYRRDDAGLFYDQIWMNYIPALTPDYRVIRDLGYNVANWNLHERRLSAKAGRWHVNDLTPLTFFHFSGYNLSAPDVLAHYNRRVDFRSRPDVKPLYDAYRERLVEFGYSRSAGAANAYAGGVADDVEDGRRRYSIVLRFGRKVDQQIRARSWHPSQRTIALPEGETEIRLWTDRTGEIEQLIMSCGEHARVVEPDWLREKIVRRLRQALANLGCSRQS